MLMALFLYPAKNAIHSRVQAQALAGIVPKEAAFWIALAVTFLLNQAVCTAIDYGTGMVANQNYELWDYRDMPFNFQGQICLQNSLVYGVLSTYAVWRLFPRMERLLATTDAAVLDGVFVGLGSLFVFLELLYHVIPRDVAEALRRLGVTQPALGPSGA